MNNPRDNEDFNFPKNGIKTTKYTLWNFLPKVKDHGFIPADMVILSSTNPNGACYVETMNLDGETNLKHKQACDATLRADTDQKMLNLKYTVECEHPNESLYTFVGNMYTGRIAYPLTPNQILLRGCVLRNTECVYGLVVFTGHETKVMMNSTAVPSKRSKVERQLDYLIIAIFAMLFAICLVGSVGGALWVDSAHWYLDLAAEGEASSSRAMFDPDNRGTVGLLAFMTLLTLYSSIIPISLYVSIEIIKYVQAGTFINQDIEMYDLESDTPALARTSNLNEELGQVEHILSDKTGTLTCNRMEFFKCSIAGVSYGEGVTEIQQLLRAACQGAEGNVTSAAAARVGTRLSVTQPPKPAIQGCNFSDKRLEDGAWRSEADPELICEFFRLLSVCHTVIPERRDDVIEFQASSPDEAALVAGAKWFGYLFCRRQLDSITVEDSVSSDIGETLSHHYGVLAVLEFNSFRKRQSVIVQMEDGSVRLYCKGADNVIFARLGPRGGEHMEATRAHLQEYGNDGLRTLCLAYRDIDKEEYADWAKQYQVARTSQQNRDEQVDAVAELIERDLTLIGCTAIEDKLQPGVPQSILALMQANIKLWVLTGDKVETAMNIGFACNLLNSKQKIFLCSSEEEQESVDETDLSRK
eukprot:jgi/Tetstr1/455034/TSEL_041890.t1